MTFKSFHEQGSMHRELSGYMHRNTHVQTTQTRITFPAGNYDLGWVQDREGEEILPSRDEGTEIQSLREGQGLLRELGLLPPPPRAACKWYGLSLASRMVWLSSH